MDVIYHTWMTNIIYLSCFTAACEGEPPFFLACHGQFDAVASRPLGAVQCRLKPGYQLGGAFVGRKLGYA